MKIMKNEHSDCYAGVDVLSIRADGSNAETETVLLKEHILDITVNEQHVMRLICTKNDLYELVLGRLLTEGLIGRAEDVAGIYFCKYQNQANVFLNREIYLEPALSEEKSCCSKNRILYTARDSEGMKKLPTPEYEPEWIFHLAKCFKKGSFLHDMTTSAHSCILAMKDTVLFKCEDIGRHNAIDKAVGYGLKTGTPLSQCILYTSGRIPVDMAEKAIAAGIPVLASKSVPTAEAVELARSYGLILIGNAHPDSMKVFTPSL
jgi:FdhD protein